MILRIAQRLVPGLLAGSLLLGGAGGALAATGNQAKSHFGFAYGQVSNLSASGFTVTAVSTANAQAAAPAKSVSVTIDAKTVEKARPGTTGPLTNGEYALVLGPKSTAGIVARRVLYSSTPFPGRRVGRRDVAQHVLNTLAIHRAAGAVTASSATSLSIQTKNGKTFTFTITPQTRFLVGGTLQQAARTFTSGQQVIVRYTQDKATNALVARTINARPAQAATQP